MTPRYLPFIFGTTSYDEAAFVAAYAASLSTSQLNQRKRWRSYGLLSLVAGLLLFVIMFLLAGDQAITPATVLWLLIIGVVLFGLSLGLFVYAQTIHAIAPDALLKGFWRLVIVPVKNGQVLVWDSLSYTTTALTPFSINITEVQEQTRRLTLLPAADLAGEIEMLDTLRENLQTVPRRQVVVSWLPSSVLSSMALPAIWGQSRTPRRTSVDHHMIALENGKGLEIAEISALSHELFAFAHQDIQGQLTQIKSQLVARLQQMSAVIAQNTHHGRVEEIAQAARWRLESEQRLPGVLDSMFGAVSSKLQAEIDDELRPLKRKHDREVEEAKFQRTLNAAQLENLQSQLQRQTREAEKDYDKAVSKLRKIEAAIQVQLEAVRSIPTWRSDFSTLPSAPVYRRDSFHPVQDVTDATINDALMTLHTIVNPPPQAPVFSAQLSDDSSVSMADPTRRAQELTQRLYELQEERRHAIRDEEETLADQQDMRNRKEEFERQITEHSRDYGADVAVADIETEYTRKQERISIPITNLKGQLNELHAVWRRAWPEPRGAHSSRLTPQRVADRLRAYQVAAMTRLQQQFEEAIGQRMSEHQQISNSVRDACCATSEFPDTTQLLLPVWFCCDARSRRWRPLLAGGHMQFKPCPSRQGEALCLDGVSQEILNYFTRHMNDEMLVRAFSGADPFTNARREAVQAALQRLRDSNSISNSQFEAARTMLGGMTVAWLAKKEAVPGENAR